MKIVTIRIVIFSSARSHLWADPNSLMGPTFLTSRSRCPPEKIVHISYFLSTQKPNPGRRKPRTESANRMINPKQCLLTVGPVHLMGTTRQGQNISWKQLRRNSFSLVVWNGNIQSECLFCQRKIKGHTACLIHNEPNPPTHPPTPANSYAPVSHMPRPI